MSRDPELDLLVVGCGPAGVAAAVTGVDRGLHVLAVDKATFPRDKTCGDGLTTGALRLLERLGVPPLPLETYAPVDETVLVSPSGRRVRLPLPRGGRYAGVVPRVDLDATLVAFARERGVDLHEGCPLEALTTSGDGVRATFGDGREVHARFVVAADGHWSPTRRLVEPATPSDLGTWHAVRQYFTGVDDPRLWVLFERDLLPGYAWVFPLPGGRANVGFGVLRDSGRDGKALKQLWPDLLARASVRDVLGSRAEPVGQHRAWPIPTGFDRTRLTHGQVLFVGDAAAVVDPMTGEGIAQALETGMLAAEAVAAGGGPADVATRYARTVERSLGADLRFAAALQAVLKYPLGARAAIRAADLSDWTRRNFARWMYEDYPRALLLTPRRWRRGMFTGPGAYRAAA